MGGDDLQPNTGKILVESRRTGALDVPKLQRLLQPTLSTVVSPIWLLREPRLQFRGAIFGDFQCDTDVCPRDAMVHSTLFQCYLLPVF